MKLPGINIQWPWSELLVSGRKIIETRGYPLPSKYRNVPLAIIETPGARGLAEARIDKARIIGTITFSESFKYASKHQWVADQSKHLVPIDDPDFSFSATKEKWAWKVRTAFRLPNPVAPPPRRGIRFTLACVVPRISEADHIPALKRPRPQSHR